MIVVGKQALTGISLSQAWLRDQRDGQSERRSVPTRLFNNRAVSQKECQKRMRLFIQLAL